MLLKMIGIIFILLSGTLFGVSLSREYEARIVYLKQFKKVLMLLKGEIQYNNSGIYESVTMVAERTENIMGTFLKTVMERFYDNQTTLKNAWDYGVDNILKIQTNLRKKELSYIKDLGTNLGITDKDTQINNILNCMEAIDLSLDELNENKAEKCKLYRTLGVVASAFITIVLI